MITTLADTFFQQVDRSKVQPYAEYWESIKPQTLGDFLRRYLFAFTSVHTTWEANVRGYNAIKDLGWIADREDLKARLISAKCGMYNNRTKFIWDFTTKFLANPDKYCQKVENWAGYRNSLVKDINGLGITKVSFALEMCFPNEAEVSCIDTHGLKLYGLTADILGTKKGDALYEKAESHWIENSYKLNASATVARAIFWDEKQKKEDSRYWTYVLES